MSISAGAAAAIAGGQTVANVAGGVFSAHQNYKYTKRLQDAQNAYNTQMWERTNEYNTPVNQVKRLKDAGINPALSESSGGLNTPAQGVQGSSPSEFTGFNNISKPGSDFINGMQSVAAYDLTTKEVEGKGLDNQDKFLELYIKQKTAADRIRAVKGNADQMEALAKKTLSEYESVSLQNDTWRKTQNDMIEQAHIQTETMKYEAEIKRMDIDTYQKRFLLDVSSSIAEIRLKYKQGKLAESEAKAAIINACANAKNADTNRMNADTNRMVGVAQANNYAASTEYQRGVNASAKHHGYWYETGAANFKANDKQVQVAAENSLRAVGSQLLTSVLQIAAGLYGAKMLKGPALRGPVRSSTPVSGF